MFSQIEIKHTKWWMTLAEIPGGVAGAGISVTYLTGFFLLLGANSFQIGLISGIPALCGLAGIFGGYLLGRLKGRKAWVIGLLVLFYLCHVFLGTIPFLFKGLSASAQVSLGLGALAGAYVLVRIQEVFWFPWASEIIPEGQRGSFFGRLMIMATLVTMPFSYIAGKFLDHANNALGFLMVFGVSGLVGSLVAIAYARVPETRGEQVVEKAFHPLELTLPWRNAAFRKFLLFAVANAFVGGLCGPFTTVFMLETLKVPYTLIALFGILLSAFFIVSVVVWGYLVDKYGSRPVLLLCSVPAVFIYLMWIFNAPDRYYLVVLAHACSGITTAGVGVALQNQLMGVSSDRRNSSYLGAYQVATGLAGFAAPLLGGMVVAACGWVDMSLFGYPIGRYQALFAIAGALSLLPIIFVARLEEVRGKSALFILRGMLLVNPLKLAMSLFAYHRGFGEKERLNATMGLGGTGSPIVTSELVNTLNDPIYFVRREAALALGRVGDSDAVAPLIAILADENANIQYEAAWALGNIRDAQSIPPLLECLRGADPKLRGYAATALGEIGASAAIEPLLERLENSHDVFETTCVANALSRLGYKKALWKTLEKLVASEQPVVRRQLSVSLGDLLGERGSFYRLLNREERVYGEQVRRILARTRRAVERRWRPKIGAETAAKAVEGFRRIESLYGERLYADALREVVAVSDLLFGRETHHYNPQEETGRRFLHELLSQNEALGCHIHWEECLVSIYALSLIFEATQV